MEVVQLLRMALVDRPYFTAIEQCGENYGPAHLYLGLYGDASLALHVLVESAKGGTGFCESGIHLIIKDNVSGQSTAKIAFCFHFPLK